MALRLRLKGGRRTNYAYAVARVQGKRAKLIPQAEYDKLLKMDVSEITRYVQDSDYQREVDELAARFTGLDLLEAALTVNAERTFHAVRGLLDGEGGGLIELYLLRYLKEDIKTILRGKAAGASREELLKELLLEDLDTYNLLQPLLADDVRTPEDAAQTLARQGAIGRQWADVLRTVNAESPLSQYEDALDKALYSAIVKALRASKERGAGLFLEAIRSEIDIINALNAARWVRATRGEGDFSPNVIPGGHELDVQSVMALSRCHDLGQFRDGIKDASFREAVATALDEAVQTGNLGAFQAAMWKAHVGTMDRLSHQNPLSILPILAFLVRKEREVRLVRAVARGRAANIPESRLKELIA